MTKPPIKRATSVAKVKLPDPSIVFYRVAVNEALSRARPAEIRKLLTQARKLQAELPAMIKDLEAHGG
jgi:hypothetical protein